MKWPLRQNDCTIKMWGQKIHLTFSPHSLNRCKERQVYVSNVMSAVVRSADGLANMRYKSKRFVLSDYVQDISCVMVFDRPDVLSVITVMDHAGAYSEDGLDIVVRTPKNVLTYEIKNGHGFQPMAIH